MQFKDQLLTVFELKNTPKRIVSLVPSLTELLVDLGLSDKIVGITKFCIHPNDLRKEKVIIGGTKNIKYQKLKKLKPDFILCNKEENTQDIVTYCKSLCATYVSDIYTITDTIKLIKNLAAICNCNKEAKGLIELILEEKQNFLDFLEHKKNKKVAYFIWKKPWMVAAKSTFINHLLEINKFKNVYANKLRYPEISLQDLQKIDDLDYVFLSSEPYPFKEKDIKKLQSLMPNVKIMLVDGEYFSWYGSRLVKSFSYFKELHKILD